MKLSQTNQIYMSLINGHKITALQALRRFDCLRLGARIFELREQGHLIESRLIKTKSGKHVAQYWME